MNRFSSVAFDEPHRIPKLRSIVGEGPGFFSGNSFYDGEEHPGGREGQVTRLLQLSFPGGEEDWELEARHRPLAIEPGNDRSEVTQRPGGPYPSLTQ